MGNNTYRFVVRIKYAYLFIRLDSLVNTRGCLLSVSTGLDPGITVMNKAEWAERKVSEKDVKETGRSHSMVAHIS